MVKEAEPGNSLWFSHPLRLAGPRKRSVDSSVVLSLNGQYSASGYHVPGAVLIRTDAVVTKTDKVLALKSFHHRNPGKAFLEC